MNKILYPIGFLLLAEATWNLWWIADSNKLWYIGVATLIAFATSLLYHRSSGLEQFIWELVMILAWANVIDEIAFDPTKFGPNEYVLMLCLFSRCIHKIIKSKNEKHYHKS